MVLFIWQKACFRLLISYDPPQTPKAKVASEPILQMRAGKVERALKAASGGRQGRARAAVG